ncbi:MAG: glycoside hydrolase family 16 protein, partial [Mariniphaga sp.]
KDLLAEYVAATRKAGLAVGFYFSPEDFNFLYKNGLQVRRRFPEPISESIMKKYLELKNLPVTDKEKKHEFKRLRRDNQIKSYLRLEHSKKFKLYRETADSYNLKRFEELKVEVDNADFRKRVEFLKDKKKFEKTESFQKWKRFRELTSSDDVKFFLKFEKSSLLENYYRMAESNDLKRYYELNSLINSDKFLKRKAYLEDAKKWEKSEEYVTEQKYLEMKKRPHFVKYFKYKGTDAFDFFKKWEVSFEDDFRGDALNTGKWAVVSPWAEKTLGHNYALSGDLHIYTNGKNIKTEGKLIIETRKEKTGGMIWKMPAGFISTEFDFTSGLVSSAKSFWQEDGIFEAKIKFNPVKETVSSFVLQGENAFPGVYLLEMGAKNRIGISRKNAKGKLDMNGLSISNLKKGKWYIFTLEKSGSTMVWKINDTEVLSFEDRYIDFPLHISLFTIVVSPVPGNKLPVRFQTQWIKCYRKHEA